MTHFNTDGKYFCNRWSYGGMIKIQTWQEDIKKEASVFPDHTDASILAKSNVAKPLKTSLPVPALPLFG